MMHKAWCSIEEVPYYFSGSSIKFQGHTCWKIDDLNPIWVRLLGRLQLSNPSDLPCCEKSEYDNRFLLKYTFEKVDNVTTTTCPADCIWSYNHWEEQWLATQLWPLGSFEWGLYPGPDTRVRNTALTKMVGSGGGREDELIWNHMLAMGCITS